MEGAHSHSGDTVKGQVMHGKAQCARLDQEPEDGAVPVSVTV